MCVISFWRAGKIPQGKAGKKALNVFPQNLVKKNKYQYICIPAEFGYIYIYMKNKCILNKIIKIKGFQDNLLIFENIMLYMCSSKKGKYCTLFKQCYCIVKPNCT